MNSKLLKYNCSYQKLTKLPELPEKLQRLDCFNNKIKKLPKLPENLQILFCSNNQLTSLQGVEHCIQLTELDCRHNRLTSLQGIECCPILISIWNESHKKMSSKSIVDLKKLFTILYNDDIFLLK